MYIDRGEGARIWDVDGNEYLDFHNGFSAMVQGHAHPAIVAAVRERRRARHALRRHHRARGGGRGGADPALRPPAWRFTNSGTESNMAAIKLARAATGREPLVKMAGVLPRACRHLAAREVALQRRRRARASRIDETEPAAVLMEGAMTSGGLMLPEPGYLAAVRELTRRHGVVLIFDEVKTGLTIAAGGAVERLGGDPDIVTLAKSLGGGLPAGAVGMTARLRAT